MICNNAHFIDLSQIYRVSLPKQYTRYGVESSQSNSVLISILLVLICCNVIICGCINYLKLANILIASRHKTLLAGGQLRVTNPDQSSRVTTAPALLAPFKPS